MVWNKARPWSRDTRERWSINSSRIDDDELCFRYNVEKRYQGIKDGQAGRGKASSLNTYQCNGCQRCIATKEHPLAYVMAH